jgi:hypothetical protein
MREIKNSYRIFDGEYVGNCYPEDWEGDKGISLMCMRKYGGGMMIVLA